MFAALLTVLLWSCSSIASSRAARFVGGSAANRVRLSIAAVLLLGAAWLHGASALGAATAWFLISG